MGPAPVEVRAIRLVDRRLNPRVVVPASLIRDFPPTRLPAVEAEWGPARQSGVEWAVAQGRDVYHWHWDWVRKTASVLAGEHRLIAIECEGSVQGLMAVKTETPPSRLGGGSLLYVDYLESAPWNTKDLCPNPQFSPVGMILVREAVHLSREAGLGGRVGLHSLQNAEIFYEGRCRMTRLGVDLTYHRLVYFEYTEQQATDWLLSAGLV